MLINKSNSIGILIFTHVVGNWLFKISGDLDGYTKARLVKRNEAVHSYTTAA
jgi:hypothetical protein